MPVSGRKKEWGKEGRKERHFLCTHCMLLYPHEFTVAATRMGHTVAAWGRPQLLYLAAHLAPAPPVGYSSQELSVAGPVGTLRQDPCPGDTGPPDFQHSTAP